ncbi:MAG: acetate kinase, partial [Roseovarius sp.]|nr:acetate kinase [Roseovarius sp.]
IASIDRCATLAPLHNPHNLAAITTLTRLAPGLPQCASFDTAFHATNPEVAARYAVPAEIEARGIRRYGFHGISYASMVRHMPDVTGAAFPARLLAFHLGNGASICAIRDGKSLATTMGYSPLGGLTMGTRTGEIDGNAVLRLAEEDGIAATHHLLNRESGLRGLSGGLSDMRALMAEDTPEACFAIDHFCYWAIRHAGSLIAAMEGVDAVAFTGGIGENAAPIRARIFEGLAWLGAQLDEAANARCDTRLHAPGSALTGWIVPAQEERMIAADAHRILCAATPSNPEH